MDFTDRSIFINNEHLDPNELINDDNLNNTKNIKRNSVGNNNKRSSISKTQTLNKKSMNQDNLKGGNKELNLVEQIKFIYNPIKRIKMENLSNHNELNNLMKKYLANVPIVSDTEINLEKKNCSNLYRNTKFNIDFNNIPIDKSNNNNTGQTLRTEMN